MKSDVARKWPRLSALGAPTIGAIFLLWLALSLGYPLAQDHGVMFWVGRVIAAGGLPYLDAWDVKGPLAYYPFAALTLIPLSEQFTVRILDSIILLAGIVLVFRLGRRVAGDAAAWAAAFLLLLWHVPLDFGNLAQPDGWVGILALAAAAPIIVHTGRVLDRRLLYLCAFVLGLAVLLKPTFAALTVLPLAHLALSPQPARGRLIAAVYATLCFLTPTAFALSFFAIRGGVDELMDVYLHYNASIYSRGLHTYPQNLIGFFTESFAVKRYLATVPLLLSAAWGLAVRRSGPVLASWIWFLATVVIVGIQGKGFAYHMLPLHPPLALVAAIGVAELPDLMAAVWRRARDPDPPPSRVPGFLAVLLALPVFVLPSIRFLQELEARIGVQVGYRSVEEYYGGDRFRIMNSIETYGFTENSFPAIAEYVRTHSEPQETVQVWGMAAAVYVLSDRMPPTRFGISQPLMGHPSTFRDRYRSEFMSRIRSRPPKLVVVMDADTCATQETPTSMKCMGSFPEWHQFVTDNYVAETNIMSYDIYRLQR